ncbi:MAG: translation initiation factor IF-3 [Cytophagales bacterium]|nr:translation initiation factor IF-3 [Cytophagales bacterium]
MNEKIEAKVVRVVGDNVENQVYDIAVALKMAQEAGLDLVEISPNSNPPVCKIIDYSKYKYSYNKKQKEIKAKAQKSDSKEIRLGGPNTGEHDLNFKVKHAINFLQDGSSVKVYIRFKGRNLSLKQNGESLLLDFVDMVKDYGTSEYAPKLEGRRMYISLVPIKK